MADSCLPSVSPHQALAKAIAAYLPSISPIWTKVICPFGSSCQPAYLAPGRRGYYNCNENY